LGIKDVFREIDKYDTPATTVLFLDALDEDTEAIDDHRKRLTDLLERSIAFRHVVITCRTQFFLSDEEIPKDVGIVKIGVIDAGESRVYTLNKLYLSPFDDSQIQRYLKKKFSGWRRQRKRARSIVQQMGDLSARPMLLAHIDDLISQSKHFDCSWQIYEEMVEAWLVREEKFIGKHLLRTFSELVAADIYRKREERKSEKISYAELTQIADNISPEITKWTASDRSFLTNRSLLNRDAEGNRKFSHRTIMEYLAFVRAVNDPIGYAFKSWTDQMERFWREMVWVQLRKMFSITGTVISWERDMLRFLNMALHPSSGIQSNPELMYLIAAHPVEKRSTQDRTWNVISPLRFGWCWYSVERNLEYDDVVPGHAPTLPQAFLIHLFTAVHDGYIIGAPGIRYYDDNGPAGYATSDLIRPVLERLSPQIRTKKYQEPLVFSKF